MRFRLNIGFVKIVGCVFAAAILFSGLVFAIQTWESSNSGVPESYLDTELPDNKTVQYDGGIYMPKSRLETILIMGVDKYADDQKTDVQGKYEQADFLLLLVMDRNAETCTAVHINRDTMTDIQMLTDSGAVVRNFVGQLALAHTYGKTQKMNCENTVTAVSNLLEGEKIDHYLSLTMDGVAKLNDLAGGVTVEVIDDLTVLDNTLIKGRTVTLKGEQALLYVRSRSGLDDSTNLRRMVRQRQYLEALQMQLARQANDSEDFTLSSLMELNEYMFSDCTVQKLSALSEQLKEYGVEKYATVEGEASLGEKYMEFYPDTVMLHKLVMELFYERIGDA